MTLSRYAFAALILVSTVAAHADSTTPDPWAPVRFLVGHWTGTVTGQAGDGTVTRQYEFVLKDRFIRESNISTYPPQEKNKKGEIR